MSKVKIELTPYNAMSILSFLREYINDDVKGLYQFKAICDAVDEYETEFIKNVTQAQLEEGSAENAINQLIGKSPKR